MNYPILKTFVIGDDSSTEYTINHGLNSRSLTASIRYYCGSSVNAYMSITGDNSAMIRCNKAPGLNMLHVTLSVV